MGGRRWPAAAAVLVAAASLDFGGSSSVVFSAGPASYNNGVVGVLNPAAPSGGGGW